MKTLKSLHDEAQEKAYMWAGMTAADLADRDKTRAQADLLKEYFEGQRDAYSEARIIARHHPK